MRTVLCPWVTQSNFEKSVQNRSFKISFSLSFVAWNFSSSSSSKLESLELIVFSASAFRLSTSKRNTSTMSAEKEDMRKWPFLTHLSLTSLIVLSISWYVSRGIRWSIVYKKNHMFNLSLSTAIPESNYHLCQFKKKKTHHSSVSKLSEQPERLHKNFEVISRVDFGVCLQIFCDLHWMERGSVSSLLLSYKKRVVKKRVVNQSFNLPSHRPIELRFLASLWVGILPHFASGGHLRTSKDLYQS